MIALLRARWFLVFFFVSGFCSLVHEVVWLRLAMASFGVTTAVVSIVISVFMGGLALGSWGAGKFAGPGSRLSGARALRFYAVAELVIGLSALFVPWALDAGQRVLANIGAGIEWGSVSHHLAAGTWIAGTLLPFCAAMGATFPLAMASLAAATEARPLRSFSYLYVANVIGAATGTVVSAVFLIELLGFRRTLLVAALLNIFVAIAAAALSPRSAFKTPAAASTGPVDIVVNQRGISGLPDIAMLWFLFLTGLTSMALEIVWVRQFTPLLGTVVYAFAAIIATYLLATFFGSTIYRFWSSLSVRPVTHQWTGLLWFVTGLFALLALVAADPRIGPARLGFDVPVIDWKALGRLALGIGPFCAAIGFLTPALVDRWSRSDPDRAGAAYALNILGCIIGPLVASFVLLPWIGERWALIALTAPIFAAGVWSIFQRGSGGTLLGRRIWITVGAVVLVAAGMGAIALTRDFETVFSKPVVRRDSTATVIAIGEGRNKQLLINGSGMTVLNTITKTIAHLPLAHLSEPPRNALVICFGMGTSFRSATTWGIPVTAVELIPSVPGLFNFYHADAAEVLGRPGARVIIDDGRRFLERTPETYDVITIDPPPPIEAAGSSMLYSREFYELARQRLSNGGILQQWLPTSESRLASAVARSLSQSFPYVRAFWSYHNWGLHFLASDLPISHLNADDLAARLPPAAAADLVEWEPGYLPGGIFAVILSHEISIDTILAKDPKTPALTDDRPVNEYYLLHRRFGPRSDDLRAVRRDFLRRPEPF